MNLFLVTSPLQLLCAIEAKSQYHTHNNTLILRVEKSASSVKQMRLLLKESDWSNIIYLGRKSKVWEVKKLHMTLKKLNPSLIFEKIFYADYSAWRTNVLLNNISVKQEIMIDDGVGTISEFKEKILPELIVSRNKLSRDFLLRLLGLKPPRKIYPRQNFSFFTFFELPECKQNIQVNLFSQLQLDWHTPECYDQMAAIGFIGQGMVAEKGIKLDYYCYMLESLIKENDREILYFPHRTEAEFVKERLLKIDRLSYHPSDLPIELEIATKQITMSCIYAIASTAAVTLEKLYPTIPIIDLKVSAKNYENKEFGNQFSLVSQALNLKSITLE